MNKSLFFGLCICLLIGIGSVEGDNTKIRTQNEIDEDNFYYYWRQ